MNRDASPSHRHPQGASVSAKEPASRPTEHQGRGIALRIGSATTFATMMAALKYAIAGGVSPVEILFYRNLFSLPTILAWIMLSGGFSLVRTRRPMVHATRSVLGLCVMGLTFGGLALLPLAEATAISFSAPLFATVLSAIVLRERVPQYRWAAITLGFIGVVIVVRPGASALEPLGALIALAAALGTAVVVITLRQIGETERAAATVFWFNIVCIIALALPMPAFFHMHGPGVWAALVLGGLLGGIAQIMMTSAVRYAPVSVLVPFDYLQLVWATLWGYFLFDALPSPAAIVGAALIAASGVYVVWRARRLRQAAVPTANEL